MNKQFILFISILFSFIFLNIKTYPQETKTNEIKIEPYIWKNVQIVGGGFVDGIVFHPKAKGICYCRTDIGGAYRRNNITNRWEPLMDWVSYDDLNLMGVESIAVDPSDTNRVYLACGTYTSPAAPDGAILRSDDQGKTFKRTNVPFKFGGNENGRGNGERMAVDPNNGKIIYLGTRNNGLWKSTDRGETWNQVKTFPDVTDNPPDSLKSRNEFQHWFWTEKGSGIIFVIFDQLSGVDNKGSSKIYVGVSLMNKNNFFVSTDAGESWNPVKGQPTEYRPTHAVLSSDNYIYLTYGTNPGPYNKMSDGAVWKYNINTKVWKDVTPVKPNVNDEKEFGYVAVSADAQDPENLIVSTFGRKLEKVEDDIFRSTDGGESWKSIFSDDKNYSFDFSNAPYTSHTPIHWLFDIEIDPFNSDHAIFTTGYGGYESYDLTNADKELPTKWSIMSSGIEETVALDLLSPPKGAHLISAIGDYGCFVHWGLDKPAPAGKFDNPIFNNTTSLACAELNPEIIVRVGIGSHHHFSGNIGYSEDFGKTWQTTLSTPKPNSQLGNISVSADGSEWLWTPDKSYTYYTTDKGANWQQSKGIPENIITVSDRVNPNKFYAMDLFKGKLFTSNDKGKTFTQQSLNLPNEIPNSRNNRSDNRGGQDKLYTTPGVEGDLWLPAFNGLYHSLNSGETFSQINNVQEIHAFGFGKGKSNYADLYLVGKIKGVRGIFRSDDIGKNWIRINDDQHQWGLILQITGDPKQYGRVYVGTHGRGILYGDPGK